MATPLFWGPDHPIATTTTTSTPSTPTTTASAPAFATDGFPDSSSVQTDVSMTPAPPQSLPPSVSDVATPAPHTTLSDSRPPTSHGDEAMDDGDDGQDGGIALDGTGAGTTTAQSYLAATPLSVPAAIDDMLLSTVSSGIDEIMDQHAAALDSLSMVQLPPPPPTSSGGPTMQDLLLITHGNIYDLDYESNLTPNEEYLNFQNKDRFLTISTFFRHFVDHKEPPIGLDESFPPSVITRDDICGNECDMQGIDWNLRRTTRSAIREKRVAFEATRMKKELVTIRKNVMPTADTENYFSFRRLDRSHQAYIPHFQLRNLMDSTSRNDIFYAMKDAVMRTDATGAPATVAMDLSKEHTEAGKFMITTLAAENDVLIAGGFEGEYAIANLSDTLGTKPTVGRIQDRARSTTTYITNHVHLFNSRHNYTPQAVLSSNDNKLRILDCSTNTFTHSFEYSAAVNCSATSPNGRLRVVVGDFRETLITNAETGQPFEMMKTHTDDVFACDWADDGIHVATAAQDSTVVIWDARNWSQPLKVMRSELSIPRILKFSPVGGGPRVLVSAEADDYINIINAQTFESRQVFDYFGRTAGITMTPDGSSLFVANSEPHFGGLMEFERIDWGQHGTFGSYEDEWGRDGAMTDWSSEDELDYDNRVVCGWHERQRRGIDLGSIWV